MSPIAVRSLWRGRRHRLAVVGVTLALGVVVALHHSPLGDARHALDAGMVAQMRLGVLAAVGSAVVAIALGVLTLGRRRAPVAAAPVTASVVRDREPRSRDGPRLLGVLCVRRC